MPKRNLFALLALLLATSTLWAKDKPTMPAVVTNATYVFVTTYDGDLLSQEVSPEDRHAVQNVQQELERWGRYKLVYNPSEADLFLVVRTGRVVDVRASTQRGTAPDRPRGSGQSIGANNGDPLDTLDVYSSSRGIDGSPLWRSRTADGLKSPDLPLLKEFRAQVEASAKKN